ncbi:MAG TPA: TonB-dependent receptor [Gemmatimonadaceae bacterium]|nr:TonB-dependent receptor [Gemmatimonadaceae bacterium]
MRQISLIALLVAIVLPAMVPHGVLLAQTPDQALPGRIVGRVLDLRTGEGISNVGIQVVGTTVGAQTGLDGRFSLARVTAGTVTLHARRLGYTPKTVTGILLPAGETIEQNIGLDPVSVALEATVVSAAAERGTINETLDQQRTSSNVVNAVTREQIARSPDGDAAQALQRVSGVTVQDGKYVFVRGLGERYTTTSLNGARLPSAEPERKVVPLDLFPAALIQSVTTTKNFTADQPGDFSGAQVDIRTREFPAKRQTNASVSMGVNARSRGGTILPPMLGGERFGFAGAERRVPELVLNQGSFTSTPGQSEVNAMVNAFHNAWAPRVQGAQPSTSFGLSTGSGMSLFGNPAGYVASFSYSYAQEVRDQELRGYAEVSGDGEARASDRYEGSTGRASILWGGLLNTSSMLGDRTRVYTNSTYNRTADAEARREFGYNENLGQQLQIDRLRFVERSVYSGQIGADRQIRARSTFATAFTAAGVRRYEPDRTEFVRVLPQDGSESFWLNSGEGAVKTFGDLRERSFNTSADLTIGFGDVLRPHALKIGGVYRFTERDAVNRVYSLQAPSLPLEERRLPAEEIFDGRFSDPADSYFRIQPLSQGGSYDAQEELGAGYAQLEWSVTGRLRAIAGARVETNALKLDAEPTVGAPLRVLPRYTDILPSLVLNYQLSDRHNLRASASQTLARPEYRELAEVQYRDVIGGENVIGNSELRRTLIRNADLRWEWYPRAGEVLSIGVFAKQFDDPIERVFLATSGTRLTTFLNADRAQTLGLELDLRTGLDRLGGWLAPVTLFSNVTVMRSEVFIGENRFGVPDADRPMVGQAPHVVNVGATYASTSGRTSATLLFNRVGRRIVTVSDNSLPVTYDVARGVLDFSLRFPLLAGLDGKLDAKNLLDQPYEQRQGSVIREQYHAGRVFTLGIAFHP